MTCAIAAMYCIVHIHAYEEKEKERERNHVPKVDKTILSRTDTVCTVSTNTNLISRSDWSINFSTVITSMPKQAKLRALRSIFKLGLLILYSLLKLRTEVFTVGV